MFAAIRSGLACLGLALPVLVSAESPLIVHEWGTFTSFQDEEGKTISGINVDDEPVPAFVHRLEDFDIFTLNSLPARWSQGAPSCHPDVTLRLETPVVYFYPSQEFKDTRLDVRATFNGGWITEFYPRAEARNTDFPNALSATSRGSTTWRGLTFGGSESDMPRTAEHVWLAPRKVGASQISTSQGETEKYLFYRGVAHLDAPVVVTRHNDDLDIALRSSQAQLKELPRLWVVSVAPNGSIQYRSAVPGGSHAHVAVPPSTGAGSDAQKLQSEIKAALIGQGLYEDEAVAMLETWQLSYFKSEGLRVFFLLPQTWTESQLPLSISPAAKVTRVMMGRIELVSDTQRAALKTLYELPEQAFPKLPLYQDVPAVTKQWHERQRPLSKLYQAAGRKAPASLIQYETLGRFRDALLLHELASATEETRRKRLQQIISEVSACSPGSPEGGR
ncbi:MAG: hypothetical protein ACJ8MH_06205 [Povalibacter sp.]